MRRISLFAILVAAPALAEKTGWEYWGGSGPAVPRKTKIEADVSDREALRSIAVFAKESAATFHRVLLGGHHGEAEVTDNLKNAANALLIKLTDASVRFAKSPIESGLNKLSTDLGQILQAAQVKPAFKFSLSGAVETIDRQISQMMSEYFDHAKRTETPARPLLDYPAPNLSLPEGAAPEFYSGIEGLLRFIKANGIAAGKAGIDEAHPYEQNKHAVALEDLLGEMIDAVTYLPLRFELKAMKKRLARLTVRLDDRARPDFYTPGAHDLSALLAATARDIDVMLTDCLKAQRMKDAGIRKLIEGGQAMDGPALDFYAKVRLETLDEQIAEGRARLAAANDETRRAQEAKLALGREDASRAAANAALFARAELLEKNLTTLRNIFVDGKITIAFAEGAAPEFEHFFGKGSLGTLSEVKRQLEALVSQDIGLLQRMAARRPGESLPNVTATFQFVRGENPAWGWKRRLKVYAQMQIELSWGLWTHIFHSTPVLLEIDRSGRILNLREEGAVDQVLQKFIAGEMGQTYDAFTDAIRCRTEDSGVQALLAQCETQLLSLGARMPLENLLPPKGN